MLRDEHGYFSGADVIKPTVKQHLTLALRALRWSLLHPALGLLLCVKSPFVLAAEFNHHLCDLTFNYPYSFEVAEPSAEQEYNGASTYACQVVLTSREDKSQQVILSTSSSAFLDVAVSRGFEFEAGNWLLEGNEADTIVVNDMFGLKGETSAREIYILGTPYDRSGRTISIEAPPAAAATLPLLNSVKFVNHAEVPDVLTIDIR